MSEKSLPPFPEGIRINADQIQIGDRIEIWGNPNKGYVVEVSRDPKDLIPKGTIAKVKIFRADAEVPDIIKIIDEIAGVTDRDPRIMNVSIHETNIIYKI